jgi:membrane protease YdiL (CAAX protease family)
MDTHLNTRRILIFLAFTCGITWTGTLVLRVTVGRDDLVTAMLLANQVFTLWTPALANVATRLITKEGWGQLMLRPNFRRGWRFYLAAWLLPFLAIIVGGAIFYLLFPQSFDSSLGEVRKGYATLLLAPWAAAANPWVVLLSMTVEFMILYVPLYTVLSFGEEFGWRAYLLPKLVERFAGRSAEEPGHPDRLDAAGGRKAALLVGVIWGVWHWPGQFLFNPDMTILQALLSLVAICSMSVLLSWVTLRSGSMWPAAVGHGTHNLILNVPSLLQKGPPNPLFGLIGSVGYYAVALVLLFSRRAFAGEEKRAGCGVARAVVEA